MNKVLDVAIIIVDEFENQSKLAGRKPKDEPNVSFDELSLVSQNTVLQVANRVILYLKSEEII